jgi:hypothetical protein
MDRQAEIAMNGESAGINRGTFIRQSAGAFATTAFLNIPLAALFRDEPVAHPEPREGITSKDVLPLEKLGNNPRPKVLESYEAARNYPAMMDGILCGCSCGGKRGTHRSLLLCFETPQATGCGECQEEGIFVGKLAKEGNTLAEIRIAFDKEFG